LANHPLARVLCKSENGQRFLVADEEYVLAGKIGNGAAGVVRKAVRIRDRRTFALKFLAPDPKYIEENSFNDVAARFKREGERGAKLNHPCLISITGFADNTNGEAFVEKRPRNPFILMEYSTGKTLESYIRNLPSEHRGRFHITKEKLLIAFQIAQALEYLHARKIVHRDVKPANIFLGPRDVDGFRPAKLGDFGVVKWGDFHAALSTGALTATNQQGLGTLKYMSPEQAVRPKEVTVRSDIYSLGITLFELFTGNILVSPHHVFEVMNARLVRGTTVGRFLSMGVPVDNDSIGLGEIILDMHLRGQDGRPSIANVRGRLEWALERWED
jgi:eukaryotic-like serine/threonine-protein kinase